MFNFIFLHAFAGVCWSWNLTFSHLGLSRWLWRWGFRSFIGHYACFSWLSVTQSEQTCNPLMGRDPPLERHWCKDWICTVTWCKRNAWPYRVKQERGGQNWWQVKEQTVYTPAKLDVKWNGFSPSLSSSNTHMLSLSRSLALKHTHERRETQGNHDNRKSIPTETELRLASKRPHSSSLPTMLG